MPYIIDEDGYIVWVPDGTATTTITAQDGTTDAFSPLAMTTWAPSAESANTIHNLIDGSIAVTMVGDRLRSGTLALIFADDNQAETARLLLARPTSFTLTDTTRPVVNMTFVRQGQITPAIHDQAREVWEFTVGFQEVIP